jgi:hypothetical protein
MSRCILMAPGPSMSVELANLYLRAFPGFVFGAINNCFELAPWADFLAANDLNWWKRHPEAYGFAGTKFSTNQLKGVRRIKTGGINTASNSGVMALEAARLEGIREIFLFGFDMTGTHYFGPYTNGCKNTNDERRALHLLQYEKWAAAHPKTRVINCTHGSELRVFPMGTL